MKGIRILPHFVTAVDSIENQGEVLDEVRRVPSQIRYLDPCQK